MNKFFIANMSISEEFPDPLLSDSEGLVAFGGNLEPETLLKAYSNGIFPWFENDEVILWWSPYPRIVLYTKDVHVSKSMRKLIKKNYFELTFDKAFDKVINYCRELRKDSTWITSGMIESYNRLHKMGYAHSVEVWKDNNLVGGLYGVSLGKMFFGESMFSIESNSSKYAFIKLSWFLNKKGFNIIDCQVPNLHLKSLGAVEISRKEFIKIVKQNNKEKTIKGSWNHFSEELNQVNYKNYLK